MSLLVLRLISFRFVESDPLWQASTSAGGVEKPAGAAVGVPVGIEAPAIKEVASPQWNPFTFLFLFCV